MTEKEIWADPIFGEVPEEFRDWYLKNSGTIFRNGKWLVDSSNVINTIHSKKGDVRIFQANKFEDNIIRSKQFIKDIISRITNNYSVLNRHAFELMKNKETTIEYTKDGEKFTRKINFIS